MKYFSDFDWNPESNMPDVQKKSNSTIPIVTKTHGTWYTLHMFLLTTYTHIAEFCRAECSSFFGSPCIEFVWSYLGFYYAANFYLH